MKTPVAGRDVCPLARIQGPVGAGLWVVFETLYLHATGEVGPRDEILLGTEGQLPGGALTPFQAQLTCVHTLMCFCTNFCFVSEWQGS